MCGMKRTPYGIPDGGNDMVRMRGWGLRLLREHDAEVGGREPYDPADEVAVKRGHENPIEWVRRQDAERQRQGRKLAWRREA